MNPGSSSKTTFVFTSIKIKLCEVLVAPTPSMSQPTPNATPETFQWHLLFFAQPPPRRSRHSSHKHCCGILDGGLLKGIILSMATS